MSIISAGGAVVGAGGPSQYQIERSLRFNSADSAYLSRTPASAGNRKTWTISVWIKRGLLGGDAWIYDGGSGSDASGFEFSSDKIRIHSTSSSGAVDDLDVRTTAVYRDTSAWYHIVLAVDTTQATNTNRIKVYVNGVQETSFSTTSWPTQNYDFGVNNNNSQKIGKWNPGGGRDFDGYMADFYLADGTQLDPTSFGEYNTDTGVWQPKAYTGSYGAQGWFLNFSDNSGVTSTTLGKDQAGSNNWTPNNFSVTAGAGNDSLVDTPTNYGTDTGVGGEVRGNYATLNPLDKTSTISLTNGNLDVSLPAAVAGGCGSTFSVSSGKWYWEIVSTGSALIIGIVPSSKSQIGTNDLFTVGYGYYQAGTKYVNGVGSAYGASWTTNVIGVALDLDNNTLTFYKDNVSQGAISIAADSYKFTSANGSSGASQAFTANFGQRPFAYTAPSGFKALCTQNLPEPTIVDGGEYFNTILYTGTGSSNARTGVGFQPDWVWIKGRSGATDHGLYDAVRGVQKQLESNSTGAETTETTGLTAFGSDGFTVGALAQLNTSSATYVAWNWKANGAGVSNTAGTISSTVSANTDSGFSIVTYTGNLTSGATVGHGLGVAPKFVIFKRRNAVTNWIIFATDQLNGSNQGHLIFGTDAIAYSSALTLSSGASTLTLGSHDAMNGNSMVAYCFAAIPGYSAFGSYTGNGSADGPMIFTGFKPRWVMVKEATTSSRDWIILDTARNTYNVSDLQLLPNTSEAESTTFFGSTAYLDMLSNGFKVRNSSVRNNENGATYIYAAFASNPFKYSLAV